MDTPEKEKFLDTVRGLRKEAEEKLTGNRHYLAIQKLDEIAEAVETRSMSSEQMGAISGVLSGDENEAPQTSEAPQAFEAPQTYDAPETADAPEVTPDANTPALAGVAGVAGLTGAAAVSALTDAPEAEALPEVPELAAAPDMADLPVGEAAASETVIVEKIVSADPLEGASEPVEAEIVLADADEDANVLPNWWKNETGGEAADTQTHVIKEVAAEVEQPAFVEDIAAPAGEDNSIDPATIAAGTVAVGAVGVLASNVVTHNIETEEVELVDVPEVQLEAVNADLPAIDIDAVTPEVDMPAPGDASVIVEDIENVPEAPVLDVAPETEIATPEPVEMIEPVEIIEDVAVPETVEVIGEIEVDAPVELPEVAEPVEVAAEPGSGDLGLEVPTGDVLEADLTVPAEALSTAEETVVPEIVMPDPVPVEVAPVEVAPVEVEPVEVAPVEVEPVEVEPVEVEPVEVAPVVEDRTAEVAAVAAGAATVAAALAAKQHAGETVNEAVVAAPETEIEAAPQVEVAPVADAPSDIPEKLTFPEHQEATVEAAAEVTGVPGLQETTVLTGTNIGHHPSYGGNRGGIFTRFINTLRGKDFI